MRGRTQIAVPLTTVTSPLAEQVVAARSAGADLVELRVDLIDDVGAIEGVLYGARGLPLIVTIRHADEGGRWTGSDEERRKLLMRLLAGRPEYIDLELAAWQRDPQARALFASEPGQHPARLIVSRHDVRGTPAALAPILDELERTPADIIKAVFTAEDATDAMRVLQQLARRAASRPMIALAMGEAGLATRVLAAKLGAYLTFATLADDRASAPGQPTVAVLRGRYRWNVLTPGSRVFGVVGWPVTHSHGPAVHNAALGVAGSPDVYVPLPVRPGAADFEAFMAEASDAALGCAGFSVTLPHKEHALDWLRRQGAEVSPLAGRCGAVNTLTRRPDGSWTGENTDVPGAIAALEGALPEGVSLAGREASVLGAGGVARAVVVALQSRGARPTIYNRTGERGARLAGELGCGCQSWDARREYRGDVLVNCTSLGLWPDIDATPVPDAALRPGTLVFDTVYRPAETHLMRAARARGCMVGDGVAMFVAQAAAQYALWQAGPASLSAMRAALNA